MKKNRITMLNGQQKLEEELDRLLRILKLGYELTVKWVPKGSTKLSGEVKHGIIFVYEEDEDVAVQVVKHEVIDYAVSQILEPYKDVTNKLIALMNEKAYQQKERLVEKLVNLL